MKTGRVLFTSNLSDRTIQVIKLLPPVIKPITESKLDAERTRIHNLAAVSTYLESHVNKPIRAERIDQMVTLLQQSKDGMSFPCIVGQQ